MQPTFTIGIEEEYQTVDPETRDLRSHIHAEILEKGKMILQERVKAEMHQSVVEVGTSVCDNIKEAKAEVKKLRQQHGATGEREWAAAGVGGDASIFGLAGCRRFIPTSATRILSRICSWWRGPI